MMTFTQEEVAELLRYEPETGKLFWKERRADLFVKPGMAKHWNRQHANKEAFTTKFGRGYLYGRVFDKLLKAHRIIWFLMTGEEPVAIDHINGDRLDNRWANLRSATYAQNNRNAALKSNNMSGVCGVSWFPQRNCWQVGVQVNGKRKNLGYYRDFDQAVAIRKSAERQFDYHPNHGRKSLLREKRNGGLA